MRGDWKGYMSLKKIVALSFLQKNFIMNDIVKNVNFGSEISDKSDFSLFFLCELRAHHVSILFC